jgi:3-oxoacyl-[acyl-carrier protein] reductase
MATPSASLAYAELAPHSVHIAVLAGRKVVVARAFSLDAKADLAAFVAEHGLAGVVRASLLGEKNFLHLSAEAESGAVRQPAALQSHAAKLPHGFDGAPVAAVCDAASGAALDPARATPWLLAAVDSAAFASAKETLGGLGLAPAELTLAAPTHIGVVASSLSANEVALVLIPGEEEASLVWVSPEGIKAVASAPVGYAKIFEAVQQGLGLKFKAAAGKLFYNDNYDFSEAAPKIAGVLAEELKPVLDGSPATILHVAGLTPGQAWLSDNLATSLGLKPWAPVSAELVTRLGLESGVAPQPTSAFGLLALAAAGSADAAWVQPTLDVLATRPAARTKTTAPFAKTSAASAPATAPAAAGSSAASAKRPAPAAAPQPVESVSVEENAAPAAPRAAAPASPVRKSNKGPIFIAGGVGLVAAVVGLAAVMRGPKTRPAVPESATPAAETAPAAPATPATSEPAPAPAPAPSTPAPAPVIVPVPPPAPVTVPAPAVGTTTTVSPDSFANDPRKFGNDRYRLEVTEKGFIQALATPRDEVLVESAAGISLQGSYVGTDGRRKWFNVGGVDDAGYQATVKKSVRDGATVFDVKVTHPRFELEQTFRCLPDAVKVSAKFTPINLRDPRGVIAAVHSVRLSPVALNPSLRMRASADVFAYAMKAGTLRVSFDNSVWARDGADGKQTIIAGENGVAFHFTENADAVRNQLNYEIAMP